jgi:hypothetical protein
MTIITLYIHNLCEFVHEGHLGGGGGGGGDIVMWQHTDNLGTIIEQN